MAAFPIFFILCFYALVLGLALGGLVLWILMIVDVATKEPEGQDRLVWLLVVLLAGAVGALIYYFARKRPRDAARRPPPALPAA